ncbi:MAG: OmpA family protein [Saprospiraceae bacterium]|nr:OmpA family protein [Saprospiraceae bacterium]
MRITIVILWLLLGLLYWFIAKECCAPAHANEDQTGVEMLTPDTALNEKPRLIKKLTPIAFLQSQAEPQVEPDWIDFRDSLLARLQEDEKLGIDGFYYDDESSGDGENLGLVRARNVLSLLNGIDSSRTVLSGNSKGPNYVKDQMNNLIAFRFLKDTKVIKEIDDRTIIYFPFNSTRQITNDELITYLNDVAERVIESGESITLTGHTDNIGSIESNEVLGEARAQVLEDYLVRKGVNPAKINVMSRGERSPIASNETREGRAKNRRVELKISN